MKRWLALVAIAIAIAGVCSGLLTWINLGTHNNFAVNWLRAFWISAAVMPLAMVCMALISRFTLRIFAFRSQLLATLLTAALTALAMESLLAIVVVYVQRNDLPDLTSAWFAAVVKSLPLGFAISMTMSLVVVPRIEPRPRAGPQSI